MITHTL